MFERKKGSGPTLVLFGLCVGFLNLVWGSTPIDRFNMVTGFAIAALGAIVWVISRV